VIYYKMMIGVPFLDKGNVYEMDDLTAEVFRVTKKERLGPMRAGLANYLWMLRTEKRYMKRVKRP